MKRDRQTEKKYELNGVVQEGDDLFVQKRIARRAYELYLERGGINGHEVEDWLQAEREILEEECRGGGFPECERVCRRSFICDRDLWSLLSRSPRKWLFHAAGHERRHDHEEDGDGSELLGRRMCIPGLFMGT